jgi:hypothetical protein
MKTKIANNKKELFYKCQGNCSICFNDGDCKLQKNIKKYGIMKIKELVYN